MNFRVMKEIHLNYSNAFVNCNELICNASDFAYVHMLFNVFVIFAHYDDNQVRRGPKFAELVECVCGRLLVSSFYFVNLD